MKRAAKRADGGNRLPAASAVGGAEIDWEGVLRTLRTRIGPENLPSVSRIAEQSRNPFQVLISTIISLRTKDEVTESTAQRIFAVAPDAASVAALSEARIERLIYPAGFYRTKAKQIRRCAILIVERYGGVVPNERDLLLGLPGVGVKTANLTLNLGFGIDAICVDTHVHRISNRMGWVATNAPEKTETELERILPRKFWIEINGLLVRYGQLVCTPVSPHCSGCPVSAICPKTGVSRSR